MKLSPTTIFATMRKAETIKLMNELGEKGRPFLFLIDFDMENCMVLSPQKAHEKRILFNFNEIKNYDEKTETPKQLIFTKKPVNFSEYKKAFNYIQHQLRQGNSYLVNLTFPTQIEINLNLKEIFLRSTAKYKLLFDNDFTFFSPESFVKTEGDRISTFPMKGTIDASTPDAENKLISNLKEQAEHATIVDLLRNDLSKIAANVTVEKFRYIDEIISNEKKLLQISSKISGIISENQRGKPGNIVFSLLPAGSVSGAPKNKTIEIIQHAETYQRGFYTGIAGFFDGKDLDSCVMIRFIENNNGAMTYKSGGGITSQSNAKEEYQELIDKVYVPIG
jgi:para-aminobenzoate synthetase component I